MANMGGSFDPNTEEPRKGYEPLPAGWYAMQITASEVKRAKSDPDNAYLELEFQPLESIHPELRGKAVFDRIHRWNKSAQAVKIANGTLSQLCRAVGYMKALTDSDVLHHQPVAVKVKVVKDEQGKYGDKNEISQYDALQARFPGGRPAPATPGAQGQFQAPPAMGGSTGYTAPPQGGAAGANPTIAPPPGSGAPPWAR